MLVQTSAQDLFIQKVPKHSTVMTDRPNGSLPIMLCTFTGLFLKLYGWDPSLVFLVQLDAQTFASGTEAVGVEKALKITAENFKGLYRHDFMSVRYSTWKLTLRGFLVLLLAPSKF